MDSTVTDNTRQYVVFKLGKDEYGVDIQQITIIEKLGSIARVPKTPDYIKGVINLRGDIIPVVDLAQRFDMSASADTDDTKILITTIDGSPVGIKVDAVMEVVQLGGDSIENIANLGTEASMEYIIGVGKMKDRIITLLDFEKILK